MKTKYKHIYSFASDIGRVREINQDSLNIIFNSNNDALLLICDGLGGHNKGEYASKLAVDTLSKLFKEKKKFINFFHAYNWLKLAVNKTNKIVFTSSESSPLYKGMGTTLIASLIYKNKLIILNIGDSRAYKFINNKLVQLSEDQSYVDYLKRSGQINEEEAKDREDKNIVLSALGTYPSTSFNIKYYKYNNEPILLCSDGLYNNLSIEKIEDLLKANNDPNKISNTLVFKANSNGGNDNISVIYYKRENL